MKKNIYLYILLPVFIFGFGVNNSYSLNQIDFTMVESKLETKISFSDNRLIVENLKQDSVLEVFSIVGVKVYSIKIKAGTNEYPINLPKGYYIIRIGNIAKKIALR